MTRETHGNIIGLALIAVLGTLIWIAIMHSAARGEEATPPPRYQIAAAVMVDASPVVIFRYSHDPFEDKATCEKFLAEDPAFATQLIKLRTQAYGEIGPAASVEVACVAIKAPPPPGEKI